MVILAQLADHGGGLINGSGDKVGIVAVRGVPVASVEYSDSLIAYCGKGFEKADESVLIIDLGGILRLEAALAMLKGMQVEGEPSTLVWKTC